MFQFLTGGSLPILSNVWLGTSVENRKYVDRIDMLRMTPAHMRFVSFEPLIEAVGEINLDGIGWAIVGGESGPNSRPISEARVDEILQQCEEQQVAFFFKQWGGTNKKAAGRRYRGRAWDDYPAASVTRL